MSQNRNIFTLTVKSAATKLLALRVTGKYEIISGIKVSVTQTPLQLLSRPIKGKCVSFWKRLLCFIYLASLVFTLS